MATEIKLRRDISTNWTSTNPILAQGEPGYETDTGKLKLGDGTTAWASLAYQAAANIVDGTIVNADINASAAIVDTKLATIATAGKVSNSATTATDANTASAIVARNASGNFTAGTITAAVTGAASSNVLKAGDTMTGALVHPLGAAATPSLTFTGDLDTGVFSPGADQVAVATNGAGRLFVDGNGLVDVVTSTTTGSLRLTNATADTTDKLGRIIGRPYTNADGDFLALDIRGLSGANEIIYGGNSASLKSATLHTFFTAADTTALGIERLCITSAGLVGINTQSPQQLLHVNSSGSNGGQLQITNASTGAASTDGLLVGYNTSNDVIFNNQEATLTKFFTSGLERAAIDSSGRLLVGTSSSAGVGAKLQVRDDISGVPAEFFKSSDDAFGPAIYLSKSRGTVGTPTELSNGDTLGYLFFRGYDGAAWQNAASITAIADGTWTDGGDTTDNPGALVFSTTADGAASPTERMRITNGGTVDINTSDGSSPIVANRGFVRLYGAGTGDGSYFESYGGVCAYMNRGVNDGELIQFRQAGTPEGSVSVSGTTVSYNGAHLSRWSQLPSGAQRTEILRGSVLSNLDEMCEWGEEDNEQLNRMKVSDIEGDKNVSGVFQAWDDDDDTYTDDFYCAMTGDFIIRIGDGVTVERGDLLMSAGDGTAKPQDDDIVRSKTLAKVTSTNVSCTYDDGSYCVPCVLMAC